MQSFYGILLCPVPSCLAQETWLPCWQGKTGAVFYYHPHSSFVEAGFKTKSLHSYGLSKIIERRICNFESLESVQAYLNFILELAESAWSNWVGFEMISYCTCINSLGGKSIL